MKKKHTFVITTLTMLLFFFSSAQAFEIFVWQHDNNQRATDPVYRSSLTATEAVTRTLDDLELEYTLERNIPENLCDYDVIVVCLSWLCPG